MLAASGAFALCERSEDPRRCVHAREDVGDRHADLHGLAVRLPGDAHQAAHPLDEEVVPGAVAVRSRLPESGDRAVDEPRIERGEPAIVEPVPLEGTDLVVLHHHVGLRREPADDLLSLGTREVERDRLLPAVGADEVR